MKKTLMLLSVLLMAPTLFAGRGVGMGVDAFNLCVPPGRQGTAVFSPMAFELDMVTMSDAFDPIVKSHFAETLGVLSGLEATYVPIVRHYQYEAPTNRLAFLSARAFLVPDFRKVSAAYRQDLERNYEAEVCLAFPKEGAECWFRARMDGAMEDFELPIATAKSERNSFYDLASLRLSWADPFPLEDSRKMAFLPDPANPKTRRAMDFMCDIRNVDLCERKQFTLARIPMADGAMLYVAQPKAGVSLKTVREQISAKTIDDLIALPGSITETGVYHGPAVVVIPKMDILSDFDFAVAMNHFKFPVKGYLRLNGELGARDFRQRFRFRLDEQGLDDKPLAVKPPESAIRATAETRRLVLNEPFVFFVYHEPVKAILAIGQFDGR